MALRCIHAYNQVHSLSCSIILGRKYAVNIAVLIVFSEITLSFSEEIHLNFKKEKYCRYWGLKHIYIIIKKTCRDLVKPKRS